jgi:hypothetical protein
MAKAVQKYWTFVFEGKTEKLSFKTSRDIVALGCYRDESGEIKLTNFSNKFSNARNDLSRMVGNMLGCDRMTDDEANTACACHLTEITKEEYDAF